MDKLSVALNSSGIEGYLGNAFGNHVCYTDDLCLFSLSSTGMQQLLNICLNHAIDHQILYNGLKLYNYIIHYALKVHLLKSLNHELFFNLLKIYIVEIVGIYKKQ